jgi:tetratricopeptide (TPR) repeat protein
MLETVATEEHGDELAELARHAVRGPGAMDAADVARVLEDRLAAREELARQAELEAVRAQSLAAEERLLEKTARRRVERQRRGRRRTQAIAAAALVAVGLAGASVGVALREDRQASARRATAVTNALREAVRHEGNRAWAEAESWARRALAEARSADVDPETVRRVESLLVRVSEARRMEIVDSELRNRLLTLRALPHTFRDAEELERAYVKAFRAGGIDVERLSPEQAASEIRARGHPADLAAALDDWAALSRGRHSAAPAWRHLAEIARRADPEPWRERFWDSLLHRDPAALRRFAATASGAETSPRVSLLAGLCLRSAGDPEAAVALLREAARRHPGDVWIRLELARALVCLDPPRRSAAIRSQTAAVARLPDRAAMLYNLGRLLKDDGRLEEAAGALLRASELTPEDPDVHLNLGNVRHAQGRLDEAIVRFARALEIDPDHALAHNSLGLTLLDRKETDPAVRHLRRATEIDPTLAAAHGNLGTALVSRGSFDEAVRAYRSALEHEPGWHEVSCALGLLLRDRLRRPRAALGPLRRAVELAPGDARYRGELGQTLVILTRFEEGIAELRRSVAGDPSNVSTRYRLGRMLANCPDERLRRPQEAEATMTELLRKVPRAWQFWNALGIARYRLGRPEEAIRPLMRSIELQGGKGGPWDWFVLALAHHAAGRTGAARNWYAKAVAWMDQRGVTGGEPGQLRAEAAARLRIESGGR